MNRYTWLAVHRDGSQLWRWNETPAGTVENVPHPDLTKEFHLLPLREGLLPFSLFLKDGQRLVYRKRRHMDAINGNLVEDLESVVYVVGWEEDLDYAHFSSYAMILPSGRIEMSSNFNHITLHDRNLDEHPLGIHETWPF